MDTISAAGVATAVSTREGMSDEAGERGLLERIRAGDREAAEVLVEQTYEAVFAGLVRLCGGNRDLAADLTQDTYRKAWQALGGFDGRSRVSTWLYRIAYNVFLNHVRRPLRAVPLEDDGVPVPVDPAPSAEESLGTSETFLHLRRAVLTLPEDLRFAVTARFWGGLSVAEIAKEEGLTTVAIRKRLRRAMDALETALQGVTP
jgi:RNA polymerase sigma-70 factor (ECF subfamily)